jgi:hypothetical protein
VLLGLKLSVGIFGKWRGTRIDEPGGKIPVFRGPYQLLSVSSLPPKARSGSVRSSKLFIRGLDHCGGKFMRRSSAFQRGSECRFSKGGSSLMETKNVRSSSAFSRILNALSLSSSVA